MQTSKAERNSVGADAAGDRHLDAKALRELGPLANVDAIRPGDVMLTRGVGKESKGIASATSQNTTIIGDAYRHLSRDERNIEQSFSHAAMFLPVGIADDDGIYRIKPIKILAEADDYGVGFTKLEWIIIHLGGGKTITVAKLPRGAVKPLILRHPDISAVPPQLLMEATEILVKAEFFKDFSSYERLLKPAKLPLPIEKVAAFYLKCQEKKRPDFVRGMFCSEFVSTYFDVLKVDLFKSGQKPDYTSPNDLANHADCLLRPAEDLGSAVILEASAIPDSAYGTYVGSYDLDHGRSELPKFVKYNSEYERTISLANGVIQQLQEISDSNAETLFKMSLLRLSYIKDGLQRASILKDEKAFRRFSEHAKNSVFVLELTREYNSCRSNRTDTSESIERKKFLESNLSQQAQDVGRKMDRGMLRSTMLMTIRQARSIECDPLETAERKKKARRARRNIKIEWMKQKKSIQETDSILKDIKESIKFDTPVEAASEMALASAVQRAASKAQAYGSQTQSA